MKKLLFLLTPLLLISISIAVDLGPDDVWYCNSTNTTVVCKPNEMCSAMNILYQNCNSTKIICEDDLEDLEVDFDTMKNEYETCKTDRDRYKTKAVQQVSGTGNEVFFMDEYLMCEKRINDVEEENTEMKIDHVDQINELENKKTRCEENLAKKNEEIDDLEDEMQDKIGNARLWTAAVVGGLVYWWSKRKKDEVSGETGSTQPINIV